MRPPVSWICGDLVNGIYALRPSRVAASNGQTPLLQAVPNSSQGIRIGTASRLTLTLRRPRPLVRLSQSTPSQCFRHRGRPESSLSGSCKPPPWSSKLGGVPVAVVRSDDPRRTVAVGIAADGPPAAAEIASPAHSARVPPVGSRVLPRRSPRHPAPPTAPDSSPWPPAGRGGRATARSSAGPDPCSRATS